MNRSARVVAVSAATAAVLLHLASTASAVLIQPAPGGTDAVQGAQLLRQVDSSLSSYAGRAGTESYQSFPPGTPVDTSISFP